MAHSSMVERTSESSICQAFNQKVGSCMQHSDPAPLRHISRFTLSRKPQDRKARDPFVIGGRLAIVSQVSFFGINTILVKLRLRGKLQVFKQ